MLIFWIIAAEWSLDSTQKIQIERPIVKNMPAISRFTLIVITVGESGQNDILS